MSAKLSYVHGAIDTPLIGETIGAAFDRTVARYGDCHALIVRQQGVRWTYRELGERVDAFAAGLLALGLRARRAGRIWAPNNAEWVVTQFATAKAGLILVNINPAYRLAELEYALNKVGCRASDHRDRVQDQRLCRHAQHAGAGTGERGAGAAATRRSCRVCAMVIQIGGPTAPGMIAFDDVAAMGGAARTRAARGTGRAAAVRRADQHPVHLGHHRRCRRARR